MRFVIPFIDIRRVLVNSCCCVLLFLSLAPSVGAQGSASQSVPIPLSLDAEILTALLLETAFVDTDKTINVVGKPGDCVHIQLFDPHYRVAGDRLLLDLGLMVSGGTEVGDLCLLPLSWQGRLLLWQRPRLQGSGFSLSFEILQSRLLDKDRRPATIAGLLWDLVKDNVYSYLQGLSIDLSPPVANLESFLAHLVRQGDASGPLSPLESLRPGNVAIRGGKVVFELIAEVEKRFVPEEDLAPLSSIERKKIVALWECWDAFLVRILTILAQEPLQPEERLLLTDILLITRYDFVADLERDAPGEDLVRRHFARAWKRLAPLFRRHLLDNFEGNIFDFLAFFTAADALTLFDNMGPSFGIELSEQGLLHLAEILSGEETSLPYQYDIDNQLRLLFERQPEKESGHPAKGRKEREQPSATTGSPLSFFRFNLFVQPVYAAEQLPSFAQIREWQVPADPYPQYVDKVRGLLSDTAREVFVKEGLSPAVQAMYLDMILAIAWQESCFRQFVVRKKKLTYLLSYNQSSVGVMQVNERIWRGLYDRNRLRWDIAYNAAAGCEIAALYLRRCLVKDASLAREDKAILTSRIVYAMYNGGPGQYAKFLQREKSNKHYRSDLLFAEKLDWSVKNNWEKIRQCLQGG